MKHDVFFYIWGYAILNDTYPFNQYLFAFSSRNIVYIRKDEEMRIVYVVLQLPVQIRLLTSDCPVHLEEHEHRLINGIERSRVRNSLVPSVFFP